MITFPDLHQIADRLGVRLTHHDAEESERKGFYDHLTRTISTVRGLSAAEYKSTLAHELGHAHYGHEPTGIECVDDQHEDQADEFAAELLLTEELVRDACAAYGGHLGAIAEELEVTEHLLAVWWATHTRTPVHH